MPKTFKNMFDFSRDGKLNLLKKRAKFMFLGQRTDTEKSVEEEIDDLELDEILDD